MSQLTGGPDLHTHSCPRLNREGHPDRLVVSGNGELRSAVAGSVDQTLGDSTGHLAPMAAVRRPSNSPTGRLLVEWRLFGCLELTIEDLDGSVGVFHHPQVMGDHDSSLAPALDLRSEEFHHLGTQFGIQ